MEVNRTMKANPRLAGAPCGWCQGALFLGDQTSVCMGCDRAHHQGCWEHHAGCAGPGCRNAPLRQLEPAITPPARPLASGYLTCPVCREITSSSSPLCSFCRAITSPDGIYRGPRANAPGAVASLVYGILGLFLCNIILGPIAILKANHAKAALATDPTLTGHGLATAGYVLGIIDLCLFGIYLLFRVSA
jgi:hypothetical protein